MWSFLKHTAVVGTVFPIGNLWSQRLGDENVEREQMKAF